MPSPIDALSALTRFRSSPSTAMRSLWDVLKGVPGGGRVMGQLVGRMAPYSGTIRPEILELGPGVARVRMVDTPRVRNHLKSVHAIALMNLGEVSTGTAVLMALPENARAIIVHLGMDYLKKARGPITATCRFELPENVGSTKQELEIHADLKDQEGNVVARAHARWLVSPAR
jgi:acyl-coenzyme A thioesterase PaaI-like protein